MGARFWVVELAECSWPLLILVMQNCCIEFVVLRSRRSELGSPRRMWSDVASPYPFVLLTLPSVLRVGAVWLERSSLQSCPGRVFRVSMIPVCQ